MDGKDHILSQADALTKNENVIADDNILGRLAGRLQGSLSSIPLQLTLPLLATLISCSKGFATGFWEKITLVRPSGRS